MACSYEISNTLIIYTVLTTVLLHYCITVGYCIPYVAIAVCHIANRPKDDDDDDDDDE